MARLESARAGSPTLHLTALLLVATFAVALVLSIVLKVEITARGTGRIVPMTRVQVIQPEFAGRITGIHVRNGHHVEKGTLLVAFDPTEAAASVHALERELDQLMIERTRIKTLLGFIERTADGASPDVKQVLARFAEDHAGLDDSAYFVEQRALMAAEIAELQDGLAQIASQREVNTKAQAVVHANIARIEAAIAMQSERLRMSEQLRERGTTSQSAHLDVLEAFVALEKQIDVQRRELDEKASQNLALDTERQQLLSTLRSRHTQRRAEIESRMLAAKEELRVAERRLAGTKLVAPVEGIVDRLKVHTIGGVAQTGDELMRIVPANGGVEVEAIFSNADIGFLARQQQATVNLDAFPAERFGFVKGKVVDVSADATELDAEKWGFVVRITLDAFYLEPPPLPAPATPRNDRID